MNKIWKKPVIAVTLGEPAGIGAEIILKAALNPIFNEIDIVVVGNEDVLAKRAKLLDIDLKVERIKNPQHRKDGAINLIDPGIHPIFEIEAGNPDKSNARAVVSWIEYAAKMAMKKEVDAITTAPIDKQVLFEGGIRIAGHTELLKEICGTRSVVMMFYSEKLKVALVSTHCALKEVPKLITCQRELEVIRIVARSMRLFCIEKPRIAVAGLNPHAGEGGIFGIEEKKEIIPAIDRAKEEGIDVQGPFSADSLFYRTMQGEFDVVIAQYHDQGLIPVKTTSFGDSVNVTLGLPIIRTSVDHGVAYDLAGTGKASEKSLIAAIRLAGKMAMNKIKEA